MRLLIDGYERVLKLLRPTRLDTDMRYSLSVWCLLYSEYGVNLLRNTLTGQIYALDDAEWAALQKPLSAERLTERGLSALTTLAEKGCVVPEGHDDAADYLSTLQILRMMQKPADGLQNYVILPTTGCNARCTYCFEKDFKPVTMTQETALAVSNYIDHTRGSGSIGLKWFGGEPLAAVPRIDFICGEMTRRGIDFSSSIVTNASLVTPELARRMADEWHLKRAQVSLDGARADYEARKRYVQPAVHNYDAALNGVQYLAEQGVRVNLRCNYDGDNLSGLEAFVDDIAARFGGMENVTLYFASLFQTRDAGDAPELIRRIRALEDRTTALGLRRDGKKNKGSFKLNFCMADSPDRSVVIDPEGGLYPCEHLTEDRCFGNVRDGVTDEARFQALSGPYPVEPCCQQCPFLPECTSFRRMNCPDGQQNCREVKQAEAENALHRIALRESRRMSGEEA